MTDELNVFEIIFELFEVLIKYAGIIYNFLFTKQRIGTFEFIPFYAIGGGVVVVILILWLVKQFTPLI